MLDKDYDGKNTSKIRLNDMARKLGVGISTLVDFMSKNGHQYNPDPNTQIPAKDARMLYIAFHGKVQNSTIKQEQKLNLSTSNQALKIDLFERYKDAIVLLETMLSDIRKEQTSFFEERIKHISANLKETGIDRVIVDGWYKTLVDNMFNSFELSTSLLNDTLMSIKDEFNQKNN